MAIFIKAADCGDCSSSPCGCSFSYAQDDGSSHDDTLDVTGQFNVDQGIDVDVTGGTCHYFTGGFHPSPWRLRIWANGVLIYDSTCTTGDVSTTVTIPAGTTSLRFKLEYDCSGLCESGGDPLLAFYQCP